MSAEIYLKQINVSTFSHGEAILRVGLSLSDRDDQIEFSAGYDASTTDYGYYFDVNPKVR